jgi:HK97 family phage prohead protease
MMVRKAAAGRASGNQFVLSDGTVDRYGEIVEPGGWELAAFKRNPIALFNHRPDQVVGRWANIRVTAGELLGEFQPAEPGTSRVADEVRKLVAQGVLKAASVGFRAIEAEPLDDNPRGPKRYTKQELLETSIVSVPANPAALAVARSLGISGEMMALLGKHADTDATSPGKHADTHPRPRARVMNISEQIQDVQKRLNAARDELLDATKEQEHDPEIADRLNDEIEFLEKDLQSKQRTEKSLAARAVEATETQKAAVTPRQLGGTVAKTSDLLWRGAAALYLSHTQRRNLDDVLAEKYGREHYADHEKTAWVARAAVLGAQTNVPAWAGDLARQGYGEWLSNLNPSPVFSRLAALGTSLAFGPGMATIKIPSRASTPSISGAFVAEAVPIPVRKLGVTSITLIPHKLGVISVYTREMAMYSTPAIETIIRQGMEDDTTITIDTLLLDATAESATRPAGLRFGISAAGTASTVKGYAAFLADLGLLMAPFVAANAGRTYALIVNPQQAIQVGFAPGPDGTFGWAQQFTSRFTVIESTTVTPGTVLLVDAADFVSVNGAPEFDISEQATLHMEDSTPLNIGTAGAPATVAAPAVSMYQTAQVAIRMQMNVTWAMRRTGMVQFLTGVNWGPA